MEAHCVLLSIRDLVSEVHDQMYRLGCQTDSNDRTLNLLKSKIGRSNGEILRPSSVALKSKNQEMNRLQLAVKLPWAIFLESVDILS
ncbi:hypothetical protein TNCV_3415681 [Trichonephila clavipes]|nr:hypothetical protein TNCV_3415681 [Trichonephila clavipes]